MLSLATLASSHGLLAIAVMLAVLAIVSWIARGPRVRPVLDRLVFRLPVLGSLAGMAESSRICRTLGSLLRNGVALQQALSAMQGVARSAVTRQQLSIVAERVSAGTKLVESLRHVTVLDATALQMVQIGEETNALDTMLLHVAQSQETELAQRIERLMTLLTPLLTVALGILFGGLIMSIMGAILDLNDLAAR